MNGVELLVFDFFFSRKKKIDFLEEKKIRLV